MGAGFLPLFTSGLTLFSLDIEGRCAIAEDSALGSAEPGGDWNFRGVAGVLFSTSGGRVFLILFCIAAGGLRGVTVMPLSPSGDGASGCGLFVVFFAVNGGGLSVPA